MAVFTGLSLRESCIKLLLTPKLRFDPPIKIILGQLEFASNKSLSSLANSKDFLALGVGGITMPITNNSSRMPKKIT